MSLEAQLLRIIEEQQQQLLQQQQQLQRQQQVQEEALQLIQAQSATINELKQYTQTLNNKHSEAVKMTQEYQKVVRKLLEQTISPHFSRNLQASLETQLQATLKDLVTSLNVEKEAKTLLKKSLPILVQEEILLQLQPLTEAVLEKTISLERSQEELKPLITQMSKWF